MSYINQIPILLLAATVIGHGTPTAQAAAPSLIGTPFPIDTGSTLTVETQGKVILYDFWASWCPPCKASFPVMQKLVNEFGNDGFTVVAVNEDEKVSKMDRFLKRQSINFAVIHDANHKLIQSLDVKTMPSAFIVDQKGTIRSVHEGFHGKSSEDAYRKVIQSLLKKP